MSLYDDIFKRMPMKIDPAEFEAPNPLLSYMRWMPVIRQPVAIVNTASMLDSIPVRTTPYLTERKQVIFPKGKRKRIRKKFAKNPANWAEVPSEKVYIIDRTMHLHPATLEKLKAAIRETDK